MPEHVEQTSDRGLLECVWPVRRSYTWNLGRWMRRRITSTSDPWRHHSSFAGIIPLYHQDILMVQWYYSSILNRLYLLNFSHGILHTIQNTAYALSMHKSWTISSLGLSWKWGGAKVLANYLPKVFDWCLHVSRNEVVHYRSASS